MKYLKLITSDAKIEQSNKYRTIYYNTTTDSLSVGGDFVIMTSESNPEAMEACHAQGWAVESDKMWKSEAEAVQSIETSVFSGSNLVHFEELKYFKNLTSIDDMAFYNCSGLTSVTIPNSVTSIGESTFASCASLTSVTIPNSVTSIGKNAFGRSTSLTSVTIPNSVISIGDCALFKCNSLTTIFYQGTIEQWKELNYSNFSNDVTVHCTDGDYVIEVHSFISTYSDGTVKHESRITDKPNLVNLVITDKVTRIPKGLCSGCTSLTSVTIPNSVTSIDENAFQGCSGLTSVTIPDSVTSIGDGAFSSCSSLTSITVDQQNTVYHSDGNCCMKGSEVVFGCKTSVIPTTATSIGISAFFSCSGLTSVTYNGTTAQWNAISKGDSWKYNVPSTCIVHCTDGDINI